MPTYIRYPDEGGGGSPLVTSVGDTNSINLDVTGGLLTADLKLSSASASAGSFKITNTIESDGLLSQAPIATTSLTGFLSSTDWNTFNGKQAAGNYITALTGDGTAAGPGSAALTLATVNSNVGSFGGATAVSAITVNAKGLVTAAASTSIQIAESQVTNLVADLAARVSTTLTSAHILVGNGSNVATDVAMTGDIGISNAGLTAIQSGVIVNADVNASAAIAYSKLALTGSIVNADINASAAIDFSKLATLSSANILVGSAGNVATSVAVTGDVLISNAGVTSIGTGVIVNADVNASAAIAGTKISPDFGSQNIVTTGTITGKVSNSNVSSADTTPTVSNTYIRMTTGNSNRTVNLPAAASSTGFIFSISKVDTGTGYVFIDPNSAELINGWSKITLHLQGEGVTIECDGTGWWITGYNSSLPASWTPTYGASTGTYTSVSTTSQWWKSAINQVSFNIFASGTTNSTTGGLTFTLPLATTTNPSLGLVVPFGYRGETSASALVWSIESSTVATIYQSQGGTWNAAAARTLRGQSSFLIDPAA